MKRCAIVAVVISIFLIGCTEKRRIDELNTELNQVREDARKADQQSKAAEGESQALAKKMAMELEATKAKLSEAEASVSRLEASNAAFLKVTVATASYAISHGDYAIAEDVLNVAKASGDNDDEVSRLSSLIDAARAKQRLDEAARSRNLKTIREVATDQRGNLNRIITFNGMIKLSSYYNYGYNQSQATHYAFEIEDDTGSASVYGRRDGIGGDLRKQLLDSPDGMLRGTVKIEILSSRYEDSGDIHAELVGFGPPIQ